MLIQVVRRSRTTRQLQHTLEMFTTNVSDLHLITGLAIMLSGWLQIHALDVHHWYVVVYLAWISSTVHLVLLSISPSRLEQAPILKYLRLLGMMVLLGLLGGALLLIRTKEFSPQSVRSHSSELVGGLWGQCNLHCLLPGPTKHHKT